ncbi:MAG: hypothetical protein QXT19_02685, partial [Candidatus Woesearchaeota archaeon]
MRNLFIDLIEEQLKLSGYLPKACSRTNPTYISRFALSIAPQPMLMDGLIYALTDDYMLRTNASTPHAVSIGFFNRTKAGGQPRSLTLPEINDHILLNRAGRRWNWPYDHEIMCAYIRTIKNA